MNFARTLSACMTLVAGTACTQGFSNGAVQDPLGDPNIVVNLPTESTITAGADQAQANCTLSTGVAAVQMTDLNPPTWHWTQCSDDDTQYRVQLDDSNMAPTEINEAAYTAADKIKVGQHTLYVAEYDRGIWSAPVALVLTVLPRTILAMADGQPEISDNGIVYKYPQVKGKDVAPSAVELAASSGFAVNDTLQGGLGDCWVNAALGGLAFADPNFLFGNVRPAVDTYGDILQDANGYRLYDISLQYPGDHNAFITWHYLTDAKFPVNRNGDAAYERWLMDANILKIGMPLLEKGLAALQSQTNYLELVDGGYGDLKSYAALGAGGWASTIYPAFLGKKTASDDVDRSKAGVVYAAAVRGGKLATVADINSGGYRPLKKLPSGATVAAKDGEFIYHPADGSVDITLIDSHYYVFMGSVSNGKIRVRNPWGSTSGPDGEFTMPVADVAGIFNRFTEASLP